MKKYLIGFLSVVLLFASIFGASAKGPKDRRPGRPGGGSGRALWV
jgi:hypothetical protein